MPYAIEFNPGAAREFRKLPRDIQVKISRIIDKLAQNPRPRGVRKLAGAEDVYRIRSGDYRVIYVIRDALLVVIIVRVRHRSDAYT